MRIAVYEHFRAMGDAAPPHLAAEGGAMLEALTDDLARAGHEVVEVAKATSLGFADALHDADAVWIVAPETGGVLESLTRVALARGVRVLGSEPDGIAVAASKLRTAAALQKCGVPTAPASLMRSPDLPPDDAGWSWPLVVKPDDGVGCEGISLVQEPEGLAAAWLRARRVSREVLVQPWLWGKTASASLLVVDGRAWPLALHGQDVRLQGSLGGESTVMIHLLATDRLAELGYHGGITPLDSPLSSLALATARSACEAIPGLAGWVGVDLVLGDDEVTVIEINPRLTTAYLGVRRAIRQNPAELALGALEGTPPDEVEWRARVRFTAAGDVREETLECATA